MTDEQPKGMEPDASIRSGRVAEDDEPNSEGHAGRIRPFTEETQPGEQGNEPSDDDDAEGHRASLYSDRNLKRHITPVVW